MLKWYLEWRETEGAKWFSLMVVLGVPMLMAVMP